MLLRRVSKHVKDQNKIHVIARSAATWQSPNAASNPTDCHGRTSLAMTEYIFDGVH